MRRVPHPPFPSAKRFLPTSQRRPGPRTGRLRPARAAEAGATAAPVSPRKTFTPHVFRRVIGGVAGDPDAPCGETTETGSSSRQAPRCFSTRPRGAPLSSPSPHRRREPVGRGRHSRSPSSLAPGRSGSARPGKKAFGASNALEPRRETLGARPTKGVPRAPGERPTTPANGTREWRRRGSRPARHCPLAPSSTRLRWARPAGRAAMDTYGSEPSAG